VSKQNLTDRFINSRKNASPGRRDRRISSDEHETFVASVRDAQREPGDDRVDVVMARGAIMNRELGDIRLTAWSL
jgi:hypothetical protein